MWYYLASIYSTSAQCAQNGYEKDIQLWTCKCSEDSEWQHYGSRGCGVFKGVVQN